MALFRLSPAAQSDVAEIWNFTAKNWGIDQAEAYIRRIKNAVHIIAGDHRSGRPCDHVRAGYWKYAVGSHMLFYRIDESGVDVVRILHAHMDFERHF